MGRVVSSLLLAAAVVLGAVPAQAGTLTPSPGPSDAPPVETPVEQAEQAEPEVALPLAMRLQSLAPSTLPAPGSGGRVTLEGTIRNTGRVTLEDVKVYPVLGDEPMTTSAELSAAAAQPAAAVIGARDLTPGNFDDLGDIAPGEQLDFTVTIGADDVGITQSGVYWLGAQALGAVEGDRDTTADGRVRTFVSMLGDDPAADPRGPQLTTRQVDLTLLLPLRQPARRDGEGRLTSPALWDELLGADGRLSRIVGLGSESGLTPTWLIDPSVVDAAVSLAQGDPGFPLSAAGLSALAGQPGTSAAGELDGDGERGGDGGQGSPGADGDTPAEGDGAEADAAGSPRDALSANPAYAEPTSTAALWLESLGDALPAGPEDVDLLPYAEPDISALARDDSGELVREAFAATVEATTRLGLEGQLVLAPAGGFLRPLVAAEDGYVDPTVPLVLSDRAVRAPRDPGDAEGPADDALDPVENPAAPGQPLRTEAGHDVVVFSQGVRRGGPEPGRDRSALGVRQRVLAEAMAALLSSSGTSLRPRLVALPPNRWNPGADWEEADFLAGLDVPWISDEGLPGAEITPPGTDAPGGAEPSDGPATEPTTEPTTQPGAEQTTEPAEDGANGGAPDARGAVDTGELISPVPAARAAEVVDLRYPRPQARREISAGLVATTADQAALADALGAVLVDNPEARGELVRAALTGVSSSVRNRELVAAQRIAGQAVTTLQVLRLIRLEVPSLVTMSSSSGSITVKVVNGLDQRVRVGIDAVVSSGGRPGALALDVPQALEIPAEQQVTLRLRARAGRVGVNVVELRAASPDGVPVGLPAEVNVRASTLGIQIYRFMAGAGFVLLAVVIFRVRRRIRIRRATHGPLLSQEFR